MASGQVKVFINESFADYAQRVKKIDGISGNEALVNNIRRHFANQQIIDYYSITEPSSRIRKSQQEKADLAYVTTIGTIAGQYNQI